MKKWLVALTISIGVLAACGDNNATKQVEEPTTNEATTEIKVEEEHRIIAGTVVLAQILDRLNLDAVAVPETVKDLPSRFEGLPNIGNAMDPDAEIIKS
ncbi:MAG TPA: heme ABC transporter substrate-binding protein IsdE, partial [Solibacillus sp.]